MDEPLVIQCADCGADRVCGRLGPKPTYCLRCVVLRKKEAGRRGAEVFRARHPERARASVRAAQEMYASDDRLRRDRRLRIAYGITIEDFESLEIAQGGVCAICKRRPDKPLCVDHDHACCTGRTRGCGRCVRGLLCHTCNRTLGLLRDSSTTLREAADYLDRWVA